MKKFLTFFAMLCALLGFSVPASADTYYLRGSHNDNPGTELKREGNTTVYSCTATMPANAWFKVYNSTLSKWWGYGDSDGAWTITTLPSTHLIWCSTTGDSGKNIIIQPAGTYKFSFDTNGNNMTVSKVEEYPTLYFVGSQNSWSQDDTYKFNRNGNVYTLNIAAGIYDPDGTKDDVKGWKIYNGSWGDYVFGAPNGATGAAATPQNGVSYNLTKGTSSANLRTVTGGKAATITMTYSATGTSTVKVDWALKPTAPTISVSNNTVTITKSGSGTIYYTLDGSDPQSSSTAITYSGPFKLAAASTKVFARVKDGEEWSAEDEKTLIYGMPVPSITISSSGLMTITIPDGEEVTDGVIKYVKGTVWNDASATVYTAPVQLTETGTYTARYMSATYGNSTTVSATYAGAASVRKIEVFSRYNLQQNQSAQGSATSADASGVWNLGSVDGGDGGWKSTYSIKVTDTNGNETWYSTTASNLVSSIQPNIWANTYVRSNWPLTTNENFGFQIEGCSGKTLKFYVKFDGDMLNVKADILQNSLSFGSSVPQITGYGIQDPGSWSTWQDFKKVSDSPLSYEHTFTAPAPNDNSEYGWYGVKINGVTYVPANLSLNQSTYVFNQGTPGSKNQATLKGLNQGNQYVLTLTETDLGMQLSVSEAGVPTPVLNRNAKENVVTINVPAGCTLHYTIAGETEKTATSKVTLTIPSSGLTVADAYFVKGTETGKHVTDQKFTFYTAPQRWATKEWTLSDDGIMPKNTVKYFYMSRFQNDDRVSPEWELIKNGNTYTLKNFMVIPAGEFRLRRIAKDGSGNLHYHDYGIDNSTRVRPADLGVTGATALAQSYSTTKTLTKDKSRGYVWDMGFSMATVSVTDASTSNDGDATVNVTMTIDFNQPSTAKVAVKPGMPYVALTGQNLQVPAIDGQNILHVADIPDNNSFTNAWIQYDENSNMLVYGSDIKTTDGVYKGDTHHAPNAGRVIQSTIMPPRYPIWFKLIDENGNESQITSNKVILKYDKEVTRTFTTPDGKAKTKDNVRFARYTLNDLEMSGRYKIYSGYGGRNYGTVVNGLSLFSNWGVGAQPDKDEYASSEIASDVAVPLNGAGPKTDTNDYAYRNGNEDTNGNYDREDNYAGRYFIFNKRTYVSELEFLYALERDQEGANGTGTYLDGQWDLNVENYSSHHAHRTDASNASAGPHWDEPSYTNNGVNYSWFRLAYAGSIGKIVLDKTGIHSGEVSWSINEDGKGKDKIKKYTVTFYMVDPSKQPGDEGYIKDAYKVVVPETELTDPDNIIVKLASEDELDLKPGWYEACLEFTVDTVDENSVPQTNVKKTLYSNRIIIFEMAAAGIKAEQRVTDADNGLKIYHPVIDVTPDASASISALDKEVKIETVYASITVDNISTTTVTRFVDKDGNHLPTTAGDTPRMWVEYDRPNGKATVHYPKGFFTSRTVMPEMRFSVRNAAIGERTNVVMTISADEAPDATSDDYTNVYMPAGKLYGKLEPQAVNSELNSSVEFNALAVTNQDDLPATEAKDGYARIRYVDTNGNLCYIGTMGATAVLAEIKYVGNDGTEKVLFEGEKLDMRLNPDDQNAVYTAKRLKIAGIPYETEEATDRAGEKISIRKDQTAKFEVQLTYSIEGNDPYTTAVNETTLTYNAEELTSPRKGLADIKTKDDMRGETSADGKIVATDVTAISESFVENYGGLVTNIEDAHVALQAVPKHEKLIGYDSFDKWYMDHGDKYDDAAATPNPHSPTKRRAIGHTDLTGTTTFAAPAEVHPLLREDGAPVKVASDFQNTTTVNNAWWNSAASVAPVFHKSDHIKGDFVRDSKGNITGWTSESNIQKPAQHREYWAGVMAGNNKAYKENVWNNGIIERENGVSVDIRDPKHGYYDMASHFASVTDESGAEKEVRSAYHLGEMPLNANDVMALYGNSEDPHGVASYLGDYSALRSVVLPIHDQMSEEIAKAKFTDCKASVTIDGVTYKLDYPADEPWNYGNTWKTRAELAFNSSNAAGLNGKSPAEAIFAKANNHMVFKVNHVNHESWFVPNGIPQGAPKTYSLWEAFKGTRFGSVAFNDLTTDKQKDDYIMSVIRMELDDYCPLAYDVRYTYPFLTTEHVTAENYNNAKTRAAATEDFNRINNMLAAVTPEEVTPVAARDTGRVPFFSNMTTSPEDVVPTAISDVRDDIRGNGFSIVYNRAAGTVTVTADGDRQLKDAAVYDATGASLITGTSADRISDQIIVLDVRNIARGAYVVSTNLGGAKFMK